MNRRLAAPDHSLNAPLRAGQRGRVAGLAGRRDATARRPRSPSSEELASRKALLAQRAEDAERPRAPHPDRAPAEGQADDARGPVAAIRHLPRAGAPDRGARLREAAEGDAGPRGPGRRAPGRPAARHPAAGVRRRSEPGRATAATVLLWTLLEVPASVPTRRQNDIIHRTVDRRAPPTATTSFSRPASSTRSSAPAARHSWPRPAGRPPFPAAPGRGFAGLIVPGDKNAWLRACRTLCGSGAVWPPSPRRGSPAARQEPHVEAGQCHAAAPVLRRWRSLPPRRSRASSREGIKASAFLVHRPSGACSGGRTARPARTGGTG